MTFLHSNAFNPAFYTLITLLFLMRNCLSIAQHFWISILTPPLERTFNYFKKLWNFDWVFFNLRRFKELSPSSLWLHQRVNPLLSLSCDSNMVLSVAVIFIPPHFPDDCEYFSWFVSCVTLAVERSSLWCFILRGNTQTHVTTTSIEP